MKNNKLRASKNKKVPKKASARFFTYGFAMYIGLAIVGLLGLIAGTHILIAVPFLLGMTDVAVTPEKKGFFESITGYWKDSSPQKKLVMGLGIGFLFPLVIFGFLYILVLGTAFSMDILFVAPIVLVVGYVYFRKEEKQTSAFGKFFGNPIIGFIGVVGIVLIMVLAGMTYVQNHQYDSARENFKQYATPFDTLANDTYIVPFYNNVTEEWENRTVQKIAPKIIFKCVDDFFEQVGFVSSFEYEYDWNGTQADLNRGNIDIVDTSGYIPVNWARVTLACNDITGTEILNIGSVTDTTGLIQFNNVPYGFYEVTVDAGGYKQFNVEIHIDEEFNNATAVLHLTPVYYKVRLQYEYIPHFEVTQDGLFSDDAELRGTAYAHAELLGGLEPADWDNLHRQNSMYGWSGLNNPALMNGVLGVNQAMNGVLNSYMSMWQGVYQAVETITTPTEGTPPPIDPAYFKHKVILLPFPDGSFAQGEGGEKVAVYSQQLPTIDEFRVNMSVQDSVGLYEYYEDSDVKIKSLNLESIRMIRDYDYIIWAPASDGAEITIQWNITTTYTNADIGRGWLDGGWLLKEEWVEKSYIDVAITFSNEQPTFETTPD